MILSLKNSKFNGNDLGRVDLYCFEYIFLFNPVSIYVL